LSSGKSIVALLIIFTILTFYPLYYPVINELFHSIDAKTLQLADFVIDTSGIYNGKQIIIVVNIKKLVGVGEYVVNRSSIKIYAPDGTLIPIISYSFNKSLEKEAAEMKRFSSPAQSKTLAVINCPELRISSGLGFTIIISDPKVVRGSWTIVMDIIEPNSGSVIKKLTAQVYI